MRTPRKQKGLTLISIVIVLAVVGFFAYAAMKLIPAYTEYFGVVKSMKAVATAPNASEATLEQLRRNLDSNFSVQYVDETSIPPDGIKLEVGSAWGMKEEVQAEVRGRDLVSGLPKTIILSSEEVRHAREDPDVRASRALSGRR